MPSNSTPAPATRKRHNEPIPAFAGCKWWDTGVYAIRNTITGKVYVGSSSVSIRKRWCDHREALIAGTHHSILLQRAWNKYGEPVFAFDVVAFCAPGECVAQEQVWIDHYDSADPAKGYNVNPTAASRLGTTHDAAARAKISAANKARSPESRKRHADKLRGRKQGLEERLKRAASLKVAWATKRKGFKHTDETKAKCRAASTGRVFTDEAKANMRAASRRTRARKKLTNDQVAEIRRRYVYGNGTELADEFGIHPTRVLQIVKGVALPFDFSDSGPAPNVTLPASRQRRQSASWAAKLSLAEITEIRERYVPGHPVNGGAALGQEFGVHQSRISNIVNGVKMPAVFTNAAETQGESLSLPIERRERYRRLTTQQMDEIFRRYTPRDPINGRNALAKEFGVRSMYIRDLLRSRRRAGA